jgi:hypothetical protein
MSPGPASSRREELSIQTAIALTSRHVKNGVELRTIAYNRTIVMNVNSSTVCMLILCKKIQRCYRLNEDHGSDEKVGKNCSVISDVSVASGRVSQWR